MKKACEIKCTEISKLRLTESKNFRCNLRTKNIIIKKNSTNVAYISA